MPIYDKYTKTIYYSGSLDTELVAKLPKVKLDYLGSYHIYHEQHSVFCSRDPQEVLEALEEFFTFATYDELPISITELEPSHFLLGDNEFTLRTWSSNDFLLHYLLPFTTDITENNLLQKISKGRREGMTFHEFLENPTASLEKLFPRGTFFQGVFYPSLGHLARSYGMKPVTLHARVDKGMSVEEALDTPLRPLLTLDDEKLVFEGKTYNTYKELIEEKGFSYQGVMLRMRQGATLEEALGRSLPFTKNSLTPKVYFGNHVFYARFSSSVPTLILDGERVTFAVLDERVGIDTILSLPDLDPTLRDYLSNRFRWTSPQGQVFYSLKKVAQHYGLPYNHVRYQLKKGMTLEQIVS